jgi:HK97 family phage portal protein
MNWLTKAFTAMRHGGLNRAPFGLGLLARTRFDYRKEVGDCLDTSVVTAPVQCGARAARSRAGHEAQGSQRHGSTDRQPSDARSDRGPNAYYGDIALWMATVFSFLIAGNAYWVIVRNSYGRPVELWYIPHWMIEPAWPQDGGTFISHYIYKPGGGVAPVELDFDDVVHFRHGIDPRNNRLGLSPLDGVIREIFIDLESSNFVASLLRNMGVPSVVISPKGGAMAAPDDVEATKAWFRQAFGGDNRGAPLVMGAPTEVTPYGFNPQQMNMSEGRDVAEERVCACLGIPAAVVGFGAGLQQTQVGATMEEMRKLAWSNGVSSFARMLADELKRSLLPQFGNATGIEVFFDMKNVAAMQEDEDKAVDRLLKELASGAIMLSEYREARGRPTDPSQDVFFRPISLIEVPASGKR